MASVPGMRLLNKKMKTSRKTATGLALVSCLISIPFIRNDYLIREHLTEATICDDPTCSKKHVDWLIDKHAISQVYFIDAHGIRVSHSAARSNPEVVREALVTVKISLGPDVSGIIRQIDHGIISSIIH